MSVLPQPNIVSTDSMYSGYDIGAGADSPGSGAWPTNNKAFYQPFYFNRPWIVTALSVYNTGTAGSACLAIYDANFNRLATTGAFVLPGVAKVTSVAVSVTLPADAMYFVGCSMNGGGSFRYNTPIAILRLGGCCVELAAFPLPAVMTPTQIDALYLPMVGLALVAPP